ncbi:uncharacterized protein LOC121873781 [Homarus americanus]|uniref:uncharacterized protein LOC121873781 n=1 Tax=Homarus americanus TaxID=6706 RepID=UPI001C4956E5|nr:uncharacterized protein LOC121873781 [Homarus americanus]
MISYSLDTPYSPTKAADIRMFFKKPSARRALSELGINDTKANLKMADTLFTITAEQFIKKWNFDPIRCRPLPSGRYQWTPAKSAARKNRLNQEDLTRETSPSEDVLDDPLTSDPEDVGEVSKRLGYLIEDHHYLGENVEEGRRCCEEEACELYTTALPTLHHHLPHSPRNTHKSSHSHTPRTKQCKITDYGRQRKRLHSCSKCEEGESEVTTPRKKLALSPTKPSK